MKAIFISTIFLICSVVFAESPNPSDKIDEKKKILDNICRDNTLFSDFGLNEITSGIENKNQEIQNYSFKLASLFASEIYMHKSNYTESSYNRFIENVKLTMNAEDDVNESLALKIFIINQEKSKDNTINPMILKALSNAPYQAKCCGIILLVQAGYNTPELGQLALDTLQEGISKNIKSSEDYEPMLFSLAIPALKPANGINFILNRINDGYGSTSQLRALIAYGKDAVIALPRLRELEKNPGIKRSDGVTHVIPPEQITKAIKKIESFSDEK
jgi:hypothetical protein